MARWRKALGVLAGGLAYLGGMLTSADAQFGAPPGGGMPPGGFGMAPPGMGMAPPGGPGMGMPPGGFGMAPGMPASMQPGGGFSPGAFGQNPAMTGQPAEFPNPPQGNQEPVSPFSLREDGMPNAFSTLNDPRGRTPAPYVFTLKPEFLYWWMSPGGTSGSLASNGPLGQPGTVEYLPARNNTVDYRGLYGAKLTGGFAIGYLPPIEVSGFMFNRNLSVFNGSPITSLGNTLARPIQAVDFPPNFLQQALFLSVPAIGQTGSMQVDSRLSFWGLTADALMNVADTQYFKIYLSVGYRHTDLYESLEIRSNINNPAGVLFGGSPFVNGFNTSQYDLFRTRNAFDGGQIGFRSVFTVSRLSVFTDVRLAMGNTRQYLITDGSSSLSANNGGLQQSLDGGLLVLPSNKGINFRDRFTVVPEGNITFSYQLFPSFRVFAGWNILYWSSVARPGDHINTAVDTRQIPSNNLGFNPGTAGAVPAFPAIVTRTFYVHGAQIGFEIGF